MDVLFETLPAKSGQLGLITLNRTQALNALTYDMIVQMHEKLSEWVADDAISAVIIKSASEKAFCAGGDIRALYEGRGQLETQRKFFSEEYQLNHFVGTYPKPYVALMNGIVMGGGGGISIHGSHRVASETLVFAMPETAIGLFPDIGASHFLTRAPGYLGRYLALSGARIQIADAVYANFVDHYISGNHFSDVIKAIAQAEFSAGSAHEAITEILNSFSMTPDPSFFAPQQDFIDGIFCADQVETVLDYLSHDEGEWTRSVLAHLQQRSPMSMTIALMALRRATGQELSFCLQQDFTIVQTILQEPDLYEGIRAMLIEKDMKPVWNPATLSAITENQIAKYFSTEGKAILNV